MKAMVLTLGLSAAVLIALAVNSLHRDAGPSREETAYSMPEDLEHRLCALKETMNGIYPSIPEYSDKAVARCWDAFDRNFR